jgi:hypothetical protein
MTVMTKGRTGGPVVRDGEMTHGTVGCHALGPSRSFYEDVLRLRCVQHAPVAQLIAGSCEFGVACVKAGDRLAAHGDQIRWIISVGDAEAIDQVHRAAAASGFTKEVGDITTQDGVASFLLKDEDSNWWQVTNLSGDHYHRLFERGDVA